MLRSSPNHYCVNSLDRPLSGATNLTGVTESGSAATNAVGLLAAPTVGNGAALFQLGSGSYRFNVNF